ncbi:MAG TPA: SCO family protein [Bdellovibrionales bacterium]|nr:SCO family protein [Bdellovibrionales bacterium]
MKRLLAPVLIVLTLVCAAGAGPAFAAKSAPGVPADKMPDKLKGIGITERLGEKIDKTLTFKDEAGKDVQLSQYFVGDKPVFLSIVYYGCPNLCNYYLNGVFDVLKTSEWKAGKEFTFVVVSMDPTETPELAQAKKETYQKEYPGLGEWHFLTGKEENIKTLASQVGFGYRWDDETEQYAHSAAAFILTPAGEISRYLYGILFDKTTLRLSLVEASKSKIGTIIDKVILFCFRFDPHAKKYSFYAYNIMRASAGATVVLLGLFLIPFWRRQRRVQLPGRRVRDGREPGETTGDV